MWWRTAWPKTRSKLSSSKGSFSASVRDRARPRARARRRSRSSVSSMPGEMSVAVARSITPELEQVEREVAGAGADLQRVAEAARPASPPSALRSFSRDLVLADRAEVDSPLGVVLVGGGVVVAGVDVLDVLGGGGEAGMARHSRRRNRDSAPVRVRAVATTSSETSPRGCRRSQLTGERTLPDVPEENYWYRRHLAVYEWIAERVAGLRVVDLACGEGYGSDVLAAQRRRAWSASTPTPRPTSTRGCATGAPNLRFERDLVEDFAEPLRRRRLPADDRARPGPRRAPRALRVDAGAGGSPTSRRPNRLTLAPPGAPRSPTTPGTCASTTPASSASCCEPHFAGSRSSASSTPASCALHELAIRLGWDRVHTRAAPDQALLRPLHPGDRRLRLRALRPRRPRPGADFLAVCHA